MVYPKMDDTIMWFGNLKSSSGQLPPFTDKSVDLEIPMDTLKQTQKCHTSRVIPTHHQHQILENIG
jgi:hypothetical protein